MLLATLSGIPGGWLITPSMPPQYVFRLFTIISPIFSIKFFHFCKIEYFEKHIFARAASRLARVDPVLERVRRTNISLTSLKQSMLTCFFGRHMIDLLAVIDLLALAASDRRGTAPRFSTMFDKNQDGVARSERLLPPPTPPPARPFWPGCTPDCENR